MPSTTKTEWESVGKWYDQLVGNDGHYYHQKVVLPKLLPLLDLKEDSSLLDLACGQGILASYIPRNIEYVGIDLSKSLIEMAKKKREKKQTFVVGNVCKTLPIQKKDFTHATIILALQNIAEPGHVFMQSAKHLRLGATLAIVLNHPCFRIPRQSSWIVDSEKKMQSRKIDRYLSSMQIPIQMHPGKAESSENTWSFHRSLSDYSRLLACAGFSILLIEEWTSDKKSSGKFATMENRARAEFPLFLTFLAKKIF